MDTKNEIHIDHDQKRQRSEISTAVVNLNQNKKTKSKAICLQNTKICPCDHHSLKSNNERNYKYKLQTFSDANVLDVFVLENDICVLKFDYMKFLSNTLGANSHDDIHIKSFKYLFQFDSNNIKGKRKKSAKKLQPGEDIFEIEIKANTSSDSMSNNSSNDDNSYRKFRFQTPLSGQLLEINDIFEFNPSLLFDQNNQSNFIIILFPLISLPSSDIIQPFNIKNMEEIDIITKPTDIYLDKITAMNSSGNKLCFEWMKLGSCSRGNHCKFLHETISSCSDRVVLEN